MKKSLLIFILCCTHFSIFCQQFIDSDYYPFNNNFADFEDVNYVLPTSDGGYLLVGSIEWDGISDDWDGRIVKVNSNGEEQWDKFFGSSSIDYFFSAVELDGRYYICGAKTNPDVGFQPVVVIYSEDGNYLDESIFGVSGYTGAAYSIIKTFDNNLLIGGYLKRNSTGTDNAFVLPITSGLGNLGNFKFLSNMSIVGKLARSADEDSYYAFGGINVRSESCYLDTSPLVPNNAQLRSNPVINYTGGDVVVKKINTSYSSVWTKNIGGDSGDSFLDGIATPDGGFAVLGKTECNATNSSQDTGPDNIGNTEWLYKGTASGSKEWVRADLFPYIVFEPPIYISQLTQVPFGILNACNSSDIIIGFNAVPSTRSVELVKLGGEGRGERLGSFYSDFNDILGSAITKGQNEDIVVGGSTKENSGELGGEDFAFFQFSPENECTIDCSICAESDPFLPPAYQCDNFDRYETGSDITENSNFWSLWDIGRGAGRIISQGANENRVLSINDNSPADDVLFLLNGADGPDINSGRHRFSWDMFIESNKTADYNFQYQKNNIGTRNNFSFEIDFNTEGLARLVYGNDQEINFTYTPGRVLKVAHIIDLDENTMELWLNFNFIGQIPYTENSIGAINYWASSGSDYWIDNICVRTTGSSPACGDVGPFERVSEPTVVCTKNGRQYSDACDAGNNGLYAQEEYGECISICSYNASYIGRGDFRGYQEELESSDLAPTALYNEQCIVDAFDGEVPYPLYADIYFFENIREQEITINSSDNTKSFLFRCSFEENIPHICLPNGSVQPPGVYYIVIVSEEPTTYNFDIAPLSICEISEGNPVLSCVDDSYSGSVFNSATSVLSVSEGAYSDCYAGVRNYGGQEEIFQFQVDEASEVDINFSTSGGKGGLFLFGANCGENCISYVDAAEGGGFASLRDLTLSPGNYYLVVDQEAGIQNRIGEFSINITCKTNLLYYNVFTALDDAGDCNIDASDNALHKIDVRLPDLDSYKNRSFAFNRPKGRNPNLKSDSLKKDFAGERVISFSIPEGLVMGDNCSFSVADSLGFWIGNSSGNSEFRAVVPKFGSTQEANITAGGVFKKKGISVVQSFVPTSTTEFANIPNYVELDKMGGTSKRLIPAWSIGNDWRADTESSWLTMEVKSVNYGDKGSSIEGRKGTSRVTITPTTTNNTYSIRRGEIVVETDGGAIRQVIQVAQLGQCETPVITSSTPSIISICPGEMVELNTFVGPGPLSVYDYKWSTGSTSNSITVSPASTREYTVTVTQSMENKCMTSSTKTFTVVVEDIVAPMSNGNVNKCEDEGAVTLSANVPSGYIINWYSAAQGGDLLRSNSFTYTTSIPGTYYAEAIDEASGCPSLTRTPIVLTEVPTLQIQVNQNNPSICLGDMINFQVELSDNAGSLPSYKWLENGQLIGIGRELNYVGNKVGKEEITVEVSKGGCLANETVEITVSEVPEIELDLVSNANCSADLTTYSVSFSSTGTVQQPLFGELQNLGNQEYLISSIPANQNLTIEVKNNDCVTMVPVQSPSCECPSSIAAPVINNGETVVRICETDLAQLAPLTASVPNGEYTVNWYSESGVLLQEGSLTYQPLTGGRYYAETESIQNKCVSAIRNSIEIEVLPRITITNNQPIYQACEGSVVIIQPDINFAEDELIYQWFEDGQLIGEEKNIEIAELGLESIFLTLTVSDSSETCSATTGYFINATKQPEVTLLSNPTCSDDLSSYSIRFSSTGTVQQPLFGELQNLGNQEYLISSIPANQNLTIEVKNNDCVTMVPVQSPSCECPSSIAAPVINNGETVIRICETDLAQLTPLTASVPNGEYTVNWYSESGVLLQEGRLTYQPLTGGRYYAETENIQNKCVSDIRNSIEIEVLPRITITNNQPFYQACEGSVVIIQPDINFAGDELVYQWFEDGELIGEEKNIEIAGEGSESIFLTLNVSDSSATCSATTRYFINTTKHPEVTLLSNPTCSDDLSSYSIRFSSDGTVQLPLFGELQNLGNQEYLISSIPNSQNLTIEVKNNDCDISVLVQSPNCLCPNDIAAPIINNGKELLSVCESEVSQLPLLTATVPDDETTVNWYNAVGELVKENSMDYQPLVLGTYFAESVNKNNQCTSDTRNSITVEVVPEIVINNSQPILKACLGSSFTIEPDIVTEAANLIFQWYQDDQLIGVDKSYEIPSVSLEPTIISLMVSDSFRTCSVASTYVVNPIAKPEVSITQLNPLDCYGDSSAVLLAIPVSGSLPFIYNWSNGIEGINSISGLKAGQYHLTIQDDENCTNTASFTITSPSMLEMVIVDSSAIMQNGDTTFKGHLEIEVRGGTPPYSYTWLNEGGSMTENLILLEATVPGIYQLAVQDSLGCSISDDFELNMVVNTNQLWEEATTIQVSPNPTTGIIDLDLSKLKTGEVELFILNLVGEQIANYKLSTPSRRKINIEHLPSGSYWLHFQNQKMIYTLKLIKL